MNSSHHPLLALKLVIFVFFYHPVNAAGEAQSPRENMWPISEFYFSISAASFGQGSFQEVAGLEQGSQNLTLSRGIMWDKNRAAQFFASTANIVPETITIHLRNEAGESLESWTLHHAYLVSSSMLDSTKNDQLVFSTLEFAFLDISK